MVKMRRFSLFWPNIWSYSAAVIPLSLTAVGLEVPLRFDFDFAFALPGDRSAAPCEEQ